jgi:hypothetical protein
MYCNNRLHSLGTYIFKPVLTNLYFCHYPEETELCVESRSSVVDREPEDEQECSKHVV